MPAGGRRRSRLPRWRSVSGSCRSSSTPSSRRWRRTTTSGRSRCGRRAACCSTATARSSSRTATPSPSRSSASTRRISIARCGCCPQVAGLDPKQVKQIVDRHRGEPSYRPIVVVEDASLAQVAAITARRLDFELPDVVVEEVPTRQVPDRRAGGASVRLRRRGERDAGRATASRRATIVGQPGVEKVYNKLLMGEDGARRVVVNSMGREIRDARGRCRRPKAAASS